MRTDLVTTRSQAVAGRSLPVSAPELSLDPVDQASVELGATAPQKPTPLVQLQWDPALGCFHLGGLGALLSLSERAAPPTEPMPASQPVERGDTLATLALLATRHLEIAADPSRITSHMAFDMAEHLLTQGAQPSVISILDPAHNSGYIGQFLSQSIEPALFQNTNLVGHLACCAGDRVYDPLVGVPVSRSEYAGRAFSGPVTVQEVYDPAALRQLLDRRRRLG